MAELGSFDFSSREEPDGVLGDEIIDEISNQRSEQESRWISEVEDHFSRIEGLVIEVDESGEGIVISGSNDSTQIEIDETPLPECIIGIRRLGIVVSGDLNTSGLSKLRETRNVKIKALEAGQVLQLPNIDDDTNCSIKLENIIGVNLPNVESLSRLSVEFINGNGFLKARRLTVIEDLESTTTQCSLINIDLVVMPELERVVGAIDYFSYDKKNQGWLVEMPKLQEAIFIFINRPVDVVHFPKLIKVQARLISPYPVNELLIPMLESVYALEIRGTKSVNLESLKHCRELDIINVEELFIPKLDISKLFDPEVSGPLLDRCKLTGDHNQDREALMEFLSHMSRRQRRTLGLDPATRGLSLVDDNNQVNNRSLSEAEE